MSSANFDDAFTVIKCMGLSGVSNDPDPNYPNGPVGQWLQSYDPEAYDGRGDSVWTDDPEKAMRFHSPQEAFACYMSSPKSRPNREDGKMNRPLTAFTILVQPLAHARKGTL